MGRCKVFCKSITVCMSLLSKAPDWPSWGLKWTREDATKRSRFSSLVKCNLKTLLFCWGLPLCKLATPSTCESPVTGCKVKPISNTGCEGNLYLDEHVSWGYHTERRRGKEGRALEKWATLVALTSSVFVASSELIVSVSEWVLLLQLD